MSDLQADLKTALSDMNRPPVIFSVDPCEHYIPMLCPNHKAYTNEKLTPYITKIIEACGYLPMFLNRHANDDLGAMEAFAAEYHYGMYNVEKAEIIDRKMTYPGDPDQFPYVEVFFKDKDIVYIYPHAFVAICPRGEFKDAFICRMD